MKTNTDKTIIHIKPLIRLNNKYVLIECGESDAAHKYVRELEGVIWSKYRKQYVMDYDWKSLNSFSEDIQNKEGWFIDQSAFVEHNKNLIEYLMDEKPSSFHKLQKNRSKTLLNQNSHKSGKKQQSEKNNSLN